MADVQASRAAYARALRARRRWLAVACGLFVAACVLVLLLPREWDGVLGWLPASLAMGALLRWARARGFLEGYECRTVLVRSAELPPEPWRGEPALVGHTSTMCVCGQNQWLADNYPDSGNVFAPHDDPRTGRPCPGLRDM